MPQVYRPVPRRAFDFAPASTEASIPPSPLPENTNPDLLTEKSSNLPATPSRTRSILNLTSSTLLGIYSKTTGDGTRDDTSTPWGTGAQTPSVRHSSLGSVDAPDLLAARLNTETQKLRMAMRKRRRGFRSFYLPLFAQTSMLFLFGMGFGMLVTHLQQTQQIAPVPVPSIARNSWYYQISWGLLGVLIGNALPRIDMMLNDDEAVAEADMDYQHANLARSRSNASDMNDYDRRSLVDSGVGPIWLSAVRSIGAFVGIAFAVVSTVDFPEKTCTTDSKIATRSLAVYVASITDVSGR